MTERRKLYIGEELAGRGLLLLRRAAAGSLLLTVLFIILFDRAKHDFGLARVNRFAKDPYDAVGSFTLRAIAVSQLAIIVTMLADLVALVRYSSLWNRSPEGSLLIVFTVGLLVLASGFCSYLMRLSKRRDVCSKNPLRDPQIIPFLIALGLLGIYPGGWREEIAGAILTVAVGMMFLFVSVALLSKAMFPCPDVPEKDLLDDLVEI
jgi:hypothetical protein